jgi:hypothetical protein
MISENNIHIGKQDFRSKLKRHIAGRLPRVQRTGSPPTEEDIGNVWIQQECAFGHLTMRVNYTTYDVRRDSKLISLKRQPDIMLSAERIWQSKEDPDADPHVYAYARVIGIYHVEIKDLHERQFNIPVTRVDVLHVRWFEYEPGWDYGWKYRREERLRFVPGDGDDAFGFIDPANVIRSIHLKPAGSQGMTDNGIAYSPMAHRFGSDTEDYRAFDLNR